MLKPLPDINPNQPIAIDLETCDPELKYTGAGYISGTGFVAGIAVACEGGSWYIPINHGEGENYDQTEVVAWLNKILSGDSDKIFHNSQYDVGWLTFIGVQMHGKIFDTMLAAPLLNENRYSYQLDSLGKIYCGEGKAEEALRMAVAEKFGEVRTHKTVIRLKENKKLYNYKPFFDAKARVSQHYDIWPQCVKDRYDVVRIEQDKNGRTDFLIPCKRENDIKGLLWACDAGEMGTYPIQDVELTFKLYKEFKPMLIKENLTKVFDMESEIVLPLLEMKVNGVRIDVEKAVELDKEYTKILNETQEELDKMCGRAIDVNIDDDLIYICTRFGLAYGKTPKGNPCFASDMVPDHPAFELVLKIRKYLKARDTYVRGYIFGSTIDGWLHGQYNQLKSDTGGTVTGRLSSSQPNMQNMPNPKKDQIGKDIRSCFLPDNENEDWLSMDYSGQEPKMLVNVVLTLAKQLRYNAKAPISGDVIPGESVALRPEFRGREADFHTAVATICMKEELEAEGSYTEEELKAKAKAFRGKAKSIGLGVMYGSGAARVAAEMTAKGVPMTKAQAEEIRDQIYRAIPFLSFINKKLMDAAKTRGYIKTYLGRRGHFDVWECPCWDDESQAKIVKDGTSNFGFKSKEEATKWYNENSRKYEIGRPQRAGTYKALNKYIQGSSADQTKMAMLHLYKRGSLDLNALDIYYRRVPGFVPPKFKTQVHDELNISKTKDESAEWYQDIMEHCIPLEVDAVADPVVCSNWAEAK